MIIIIIIILVMFGCGLSPLLLDSINFSLLIEGFFSLYVSRLTVMSIRVLIK